MFRKIFSIFFVSLCLIMPGCREKKKEICADHHVLELATTKFGKHSNVYSLLNMLKKQNYISQTYSEKTHSEFVQIQHLFELAFASMIKYKQAIKVVGVIYTPTPSTPLRTDGTNINLLLNPDQIKHPEIIDTLVSRYESLHQLLKSGNTLYNIRGNVIDSLPGMTTYNSNIKIYSNLKDIRAKKINQDFVGASYLLECHNGEKILFSISSNQISSRDPKAEWELFYGNINENDKLYNQFITLQNAYKEHGVDFRFN